MTNLVTHGSRLHVSQEHFSSLTVCVFLLTLVGSSLQAHAILVNSTPAARQVVRGDHVTIGLSFNSRVDGKRSQFTLISTEGNRRLSLDSQKEPNKLQAQANALKPGSYRLIWQVLAADGHITRGQIPFQVQ